MAAALAGFGLTAVAAWALSSGLTEPPSQVFTPSQNVEMSLPYRGFCQRLTLHLGDTELALSSEDVRSGLARISFPLPAGRHDLLLRFDTMVPGMQRDYPFTVVVDQTPPPLLLADLPLLSLRNPSTVAEAVRLEGTVEPEASLLLGDRALPLDSQGKFGLDWPLQAGWNHLLLRAEDRAGNRTTKKLSIFRDVSDPDISWRTAPGHVFKENKARLEITVVDDGPLAAVTSKVDGKPITWHRKSADHWLGMTETLPEGRHEVELKVVDSSGRIATSRREIVIDSSEVLGDAVLALGARGADVIQLHKRLLDAGYMTVQAGSVFTAATKQALENLQADEGFEMTGRADAPTLIALGPRLVINLSQFSLVLERPGQPDRRWSIAAGAPEFPTPTGRFVVWEKVEDPTWLPPKSDWAKDAKPVEPGPDNPLGTRWIGLDWGGVGIHGTNAPWTVGSAASHGCMRMETSQVEELFTLVEVGTPVVILGGWEDDPLLKKFWP
jgi:hypothetical protein